MYTQSLLILVRIAFLITGFSCFITVKLLPCTTYWLSSKVLTSVTNGDIGGEIEAEAIVKGMRDSEGLKLVFWMDTPSGKYEDIEEIKTRKLSKGEEASYKAKIKPKEEGFYTVYANLYDDHGRIDRDYDIIWVES